MEQTGVIDQKTTGGLVMSIRSTGAGLCMTCNNADTCVHRKRRGCDAVHCELFDDYARTNGHRVKETGPVVLMAAPSAEQAKGLCLNCVHRDACQLPKPVSGVWHCEEYE